MKRFLVAMTVAAMFAVTGTASAQISFPGAGGFGPIADGVGNGTSGAPSISNATVPAGTGLIQNVSIDFGPGGLTHTFVGDLTVRLTHPNGTTGMDIMLRPGRGSTAAFGFGSDFVAANTYAFQDAGTVLFNVAPPAIIATGVYEASSSNNPPDATGINNP
jgi:hypothetical protein